MAYDKDICDKSCNGRDWYNMRVLVTGGAGYIGSVVSEELLGDAVRRLRRDRGVVAHERHGERVEARDLRRDRLPHARCARFRRRLLSSRFTDTDRPGANRQGRRLRAAGLQQDS